MKTDLNTIIQIMNNGYIDKQELINLDEMHVKYLNKNIKKTCSNCINEALTNLYQHLTLKLYEQI